VNAQLTQQLAALTTADAQIRIVGTNVAAAMEALRVTQERYRLGAGTLLDLLTAQANMTQAEVNQVSARYNYLIARTRSRRWWDTPWTSVQPTAFRTGDTPLPDTVILTHKLTRDYDMGGEVVHALRGVEIQMQRNEFVAVMGPSVLGNRRS